jgi:hypothetical protein
MAGDAAMARFRKRPVVVQAEQWHPGAAVPGVLLSEAEDVPSRSGGVAFTIPPRPYVVTIHNQRAWLAPGDWVITEPDGVHHYPCKPDVFAATYEPAE